MIVGWFHNNLNLRWIEEMAWISYFFNQTIFSLATWPILMVPTFFFSFFLEILVFLHSSLLCFLFFPEFLSSSTSHHSPLFLFFLSFFLKLSSFIFFLFSFFLPLVHPFLFLWFFFLHPTPPLLHHQNLKLLLAILSPFFSVFL